MDNTDEKSWEGWWWFPGEGSRDDERGPHGALTFTEADGARLRLIVPPGGRLANLGVLEDEGGQERDAIHGVTVFGKKVSLLDARRTNVEAALGAGRVEQWEGYMVVDGEHVDSLDALEVDDLGLTIRGLREWLDGDWQGPLGFASVDWIHKSRSRRTVPTRRERLQERRRVRLNVGRMRRYERLSKSPTISGLDVELPNGIRLIAGVGEQPRRTSRYYRSSERTASLHVSAKRPRPLMRLLDEAVDPFVNLLVFALGDQARVESMTITRYEARGKEVLPRLVRLYARPWPQLRNARSAYQTNLMFPRRALGVRERFVLSRWWDMLKELDPASLTLFGVWNAESIYLENSLLNLMSFAEAYHERFLDHPHLGLDEHRKMVDQAVKPFPAEVRRLYRQALAHANTQTQRERLTDLVERAEAWVPGVAPDPRELVGQLVDTRNHLTHWEPKRANVVEGQDMWRAVERLSAAIRVNMLIEIGMEPDAIEYGFLRRYGRSVPFRSQGP